MVHCKDAKRWLDDYRPVALLDAPKRSLYAPGGEGEAADA